MPAPTAAAATRNSRLLTISVLAFAGHRPSPASTASQSIEYSDLRPTPQAVFRLWCRSSERPSCPGRSGNATIYVHRAHRRPRNRRRDRPCSRKRILLSRRRTVRRIWRYLLRRSRRLEHSGSEQMQPKRPVVAVEDRRPAFPIPEFRREPKREFAPAIAGSGFGSQPSRTALGALGVDSVAYDAVLSVSLLALPDCRYSCSLWRRSRAAQEEKRDGDGPPGAITLSRVPGPSKKTGQWHTRPHKRLLPLARPRQNPRLDRPMYVRHARHRKWVCQARLVRKFERVHLVFSPHRSCPHDRRDGR